MNQILERLTVNAAKYHLSINIKKTKFMLIGNHFSNFNIKDVKINNKVLELVDHFVYTGRVLSNKGDDTAALSVRIKGNVLNLDGMGILNKVFYLSSQ